MPKHVPTLCLRPRCRVPISNWLLRGLFFQNEVALTWNKTTVVRIPASHISRCQVSRLQTRVLASPSARVSVSLLDTAQQDGAWGAGNTLSPSVFSVAEMGSLLQVYDNRGLNLLRKFMNIKGVVFLSIAAANHSGISPDSGNGSSWSITKRMLQTWKLIFSVYH